jgi:hypothetical protein
MDVGVRALSIELASSEASALRLGQQRATASAQAAQQHPK